MRRFVPTVCGIVLGGVLQGQGMRVMAQGGNVQAGVQAELQEKAQEKPMSEAARLERMREVVDSFAKDNAFMGAVLVAEGDRVLMDKGYGQADLEWGIPNTPEVRFRLGSITKQFTATLILLLQQDGKLSLQDPVSKYLPDTPKAWEKITLAELLGHTSGIPNFTNDPRFMTWRMSPHTTAEEILFFRDRPLDFPPGTKFSYSNSGYEVLGAVVEKVTGKTYGQMLRERIFEPVGMHNTGLDEDELIVPKRAQGYTQGATGLVHAVSESMTVPWAAGAIYSTTGDLLLWEHALFGHKVLNEASLKQMTTPGLGNYALGVFVHPGTAEATVVNHAGGIEGFNTDMTYVPERRVCVVVLGNVNGEAPSAIGAKLVDLMLGKPVTLATERKVVPIAPTELPKFVGTYQLAPTFALTVRVAGDHLEVQATGQSPLPLFYEGAADGHPRFFLKAVEAELEFVPEASGRMGSVILHQGGHDQTGARQ